MEQHRFEERRLKEERGILKAIVLQMIAPVVFATPMLLSLLFHLLVGVNTRDYPLYNAPHSLQSHAISLVRRSADSADYLPADDERRHYAVLCETLLDDGAAAD